MNNYLKYKAGWIQLLVFGSLTIVISLVLSLISISVIMRIYQVPAISFQTLDLTSPAIVSAFKVYQAVAHISLFLIPPLVFAYMSDKKPLKYIGFKKPIPLGFLLIATVIIVGAFPMVAWLAEINQNIHLPAGMQALEKSLRDAEVKGNELLQSILSMKSLADLLVTLFILAVLPAIGEELFFRGVLQRIFIQIARRPWVGIIITSILFSAFHGMFLGFIPRAILGVVLGALFWYSGSLWPGILAHFLHNAIQIIVVYYNPALAEKDPEFTAWLIAGSTLLVAGLMMWMGKISQTYYAEVYDTDDDFPVGTRDQHTP